MTKDLLAKFALLNLEAVRAAIKAAGLTKDQAELFMKAYKDSLASMAFDLVDEDEGKPN